jgi:hypothetical protein
MEPKSKCFRNGKLVIVLVLWILDDVFQMGKILFYCTLIHLNLDKK